MPLTTDQKLLTLGRDIIEGFDKIDGGVHPGFRPAHAKGILLTGVFTPSSEAASLAGTLSYGQRKLLELAYVLVADPAIVLLDEPAGGVNLSLVNHIAARIRDLNAAGKTFLIVEHNMEFVMGLCHQITVLDSGTVVAAGPPDIIRTDRRVLDAYLGEDIEDIEDIEDTDEDPDPAEGT